MHASRPSFLSVILSVVPGLGHVWLGRSRRGLLFFMGTTGLLNLAFLAFATRGDPFGPWTFRLVLAAGLTVWLMAIADTLRLGVLGRLPGSRDRRIEQFESGLSHFVAGRNGAARAAFERMLDLDPGDAVARLHLCRLDRRIGNQLGVKKHASKALDACPRNPVARELRLELEHARQRKKRS